MIKTGLSLETVAVTVAMATGQLDSCRCINNVLCYEEKNTFKKKHNFLIPAVNFALFASM